MNTPQESELDNNGKRGKLYLQKRYPEFVKYLEQRYPDVNKFSAAIYLYYRNMEHPKCPMCGKPTPFLDYTRGFQRCCSSKCATNDPTFREKSKQTNLRKYGVEHASQNKDIKKKIVDTTVSRHGGMGNASESTKAKQHSTMLDKYGTTHALQVDGVWEKARQTCLERYGSVWASQNEEISKKISNGLLKAAKRDDIVSAFRTSEGEIRYICKCPHSECTKCEERLYEISASRYFNRKKDLSEPCTHILPEMKEHSTGTTGEIYIRKIVGETNNEVIYNDRTILGGQELDIYIPELKLAIEYNGVYWHSDYIKSPSYHVNKFKKCAQKGIQLIQIWEDQFKTKAEAVANIIRSKCGLYKTRCYARNTEITELSPQDANVFYNKYHLQGAVNGSCHYGLKYGEALVAAASFGKGRYSDGWELLRFCVASDYQVVGGAGKLLKHFINTYKPTKVISYSSNDISDGSLYKKLGFEKAGESQSYWYIDKTYKRYHRSNFTKGTLVKKGWLNDGETEATTMKSHGFIRIYDSGQTKWVLNLDK